MAVIVGLTALCVIMAILAVTFCGSPKDKKKEPEALSRVEARYVESDEYKRQRAELAATNAEVETEALRKGIIESV